MDYKSESPENIKELKRLSKEKSNYKNRLVAVEELGNFKCQQSKDILWNLMMNDKVYIVQETAFRKLQSFGENVKLPKKKKGNLIKGIDKKLAKVRDSISSEFSLNIFKPKFKELFPEEFDVYSYEKGEKFDDWVSNILSSLPKK